MKKSLCALSLHFTLACFLFASKLTVSFASGGALLATFPETVYFFEKDPKKSEIYASTSKNILVIDPAQQKIVHKIQAWGEPRGLTLSIDGKKLYVATSTAQQIMVIDTESREILQPISVPYLPFDLKVASNGYLYATVSNGFYHGFMQVNLENEKFNKLIGDSVGIDFSSMMQISPDHNTLYIANTNSTNSYYDYGKVWKYDVSTDAVPLIVQYEGLVSGGYYGGGAGGRDLHLTADGRYMYFVQEYGNRVIRGGYDIARIRTSDMSIQGLSAPLII